MPFLLLRKCRLFLGANEVIVVSLSRLSELLSLEVLRRKVVSTHKGKRLSKAQELGSRGKTPASLKCSSPWTSSINVGHRNVSHRFPDLSLLAYKFPCESGRFCPRQMCILAISEKHCWRTAVRKTPSISGQSWADFTPSPLAGQAFLWVVGLMKWTEAVRAPLMEMQS